MGWPDRAPALQDVESCGGGPAPLPAKIFPPRRNKTTSVGFTTQGARPNVGPGEVRRSIGMRRLPAISLDPMKFLQAFAAGLRAEFADAACAPMPEYLVALMQQLDGDRNEHSGEGGEYGTSATEPSSGVGRRGRRRAAPPRGEAA